MWVAKSLQSAQRGYSSPVTSRQLRDHSLLPPTICTGNESQVKLNGLDIRESNLPHLKPPAVCTIIAGSLILSINLTVETHV